MAHTRMEQKDGWRGCECGEDAVDQCIYCAAQLCEEHRLSAPRSDALALCESCEERHYPEAALLRRHSEFVQAVA